jgi:hypothetical protein
LPVQAFAFPLFTNTARTNELGRRPSHQSTEEARTAFVVNAPPALQGTALNSKPQSGAFDTLMPAAAAEAENPRAAVTPPAISRIFAILTRDLASIFFSGRS